MLAYAVRFEVDEVILFYPNTINSYQDNSSEIIIKDKLANNKEIFIKAFQLPIINKDLLNKNLEINTKLNDLFIEQKKELKLKIESIFNND